jgi:hypothetical protein
MKLPTRRVAHEDLEPFGAPGPSISERLSAYVAVEAPKLPGHELRAGTGRRAGLERRTPVGWGATKVMRYGEERRSGRDRRRFDVGAPS